jgi:hypothetical protein
MTWQTTKTTDSYTPAVYLEPGKPPRDCNVKAIKLDSVEVARRMLAAGNSAWVRAEDVTAVTGAGNGIDG